MSTAPSAEETAGLTAQLAAVADELEAHLPEFPLPRFIAPDEDGPAEGRCRSGAPCPTTWSSAPSTRWRCRSSWSSSRPRRSGWAVFDVAYEGAPGCVHGAVLAATFDIVLTAANAIEGATGPTVRLALRYLRPTLTDEEAVFEGWVTEVTARRVFCKGRIVQDGTVTVEAEGEFAIFNHRELVNRMASSRSRCERPPDVGGAAEAPGTGGNRRAPAGGEWPDGGSGRRGPPVPAALAGPGRLRLRAPDADPFRRD